MSHYSLKIGIPATLTGELSLQGKESFKGIHLWFRECMNKGGIKVKGLGERVIPSIIHHDDESNPDNTYSNTLKLINSDKVDLLLGPYSSSLTIACINAASESSRVVWNHGGSSDEIHDIGYRNIVSTITEAGKYFEGTINLILELENHNSRIAIVRKKQSRFSKHVSEGATKYAEIAGITTELLEFEGGTDDFSKIFEKISLFKPDFIFCVGSAADDINFCKKLLKEKSIKYKFTATLAASINEFKSELGSSCNYFVATSQWEPVINTEVDFGPDSKSFCKSFFDEFGYLPDYTAAQAYNICIIIEQLLKTSGLDEQMLLRNALNSRFKTFYGNFETDSSTGRQIGHNMIVVQWQNEMKKIIHPSEVSDSEFICSQ